MSKPRRLTVFKLEGGKANSDTRHMDSLVGAKLLSVSSKPKGLAAMKKEPSKLIVKSEAK